MNCSRNSVFDLPYWF